jgi:acyl-CoA hydrolase
MAVRQIGLDAVPVLLARSERLFMPGTSGEPVALHALAATSPESFAHLSVLTSFVSGLNRFDGPALRASGHVTGFFPPGRGGPARYRQLCATYSGITEEIGRFAPDILFVPVSPPDRAGMVSTGLCAEFFEAAMASASCRVALIQSDMPVLLDGLAFALDAFTHVVRDGPAAPAAHEGADGGDPVADAIAGHVARLIRDGDTVQAGIGRIPARVFARLTGRRRLRLHSGLLSDPLRILTEAGALDPDSPVCCATIVGSRGFQRWLDGRPGIALRPIAHTHGFATLAAIDGFVAVNSALEVDLSGQVNAERVGGRAVSARGGLPDFAAAAHRSRGGLSIVALPSTANGRSRIVARLGAGAPVSVAGHDVDIVVTEHGAADLRGKDAEERARAIVAVAAPEQRHDLLATLEA